MSDLALKMAQLHPGKRWRVVFDDQGGERLEWNEPGPAPKLADVEQVELPRGQSLEARISALEARLASLERGRP